MALSRLRKRLAAMRPSAQTGDRPRVSPVDPERRRRAEETRKQIAHTRRRLALPALSSRSHARSSASRTRDRGNGDEARSASRAGRR